VTQITHEEARSLIQRKADKLLDPEKRETLNLHLNGCADCNAYAAEVNDLESALRRVMGSQWKSSPSPLDVHLIINRAQGKPTFGLKFNYAAMRTAALVVVFMIAIIGFWKFSTAQLSIPPGMSVSAMPIPTPSVFQTTTHISFQGCKSVSYQVKSNDTLESIAGKFLVAKEDIMAFNNMGTDTIVPSMEIKIPQCNSTPTGTIHAPATTITITPQLETVTYTPG
jgi:hypothetical protein